MVPGPFASLPGNWHTAAAMPLISYTKSNVPPPSSVEQRGVQTDCTESSCKPSGGAPAWERQRGIARSAGERTERYVATALSDRGRQVVG